ncbi:MAG TPA: hypothetical protein PLH91_04715 [Tenuifilaceae bacterium]|nr:hypothetical protein [Tenuifilaceae bacterium]HPI44511.1 hypothetical protein [Tenuifilaceae bacterium]HPN21549.1 hypothetical protein [Tenuifilaceae bacterium]HPV56548.1 hypothetical protein [Tenuifilaceae bacterium]
MHTIRIRVNDKVYDKLMWLLRKFSPDELEIIAEDKEYSQNQKYLTNELKDIIEDNATFIDYDEAEKRLENIIKKNENSI